MSLVKVILDVDDGGWKVLLDGEQQGELYLDRDDAETAGEQLAERLKANFQMHRKDGSIRLTLTRDYQTQDE
jgi:hypothetical protein